MKRSELIPGEVYAVEQKTTMLPVLLASTIPVTLARTGEGFALSRARAHQGTQGGGLTADGGSATGVIGVPLPVSPSSVAARDWLTTGARLADVAEQPPQDFPVTIAQAYHLARDWAQLAHEVARDGQMRMNVGYGRMVARFTDIDDRGAEQRTSVQAHVFAPRAFRAPWAAWVAQRDRTTREHDENERLVIADMTAIRERLATVAGQPLAVWFAEQDSYVVMRRHDFHTLLDMIEKGSR